MGNCGIFKKKIFFHKVKMSTCQVFTVDSHESGTDERKIKIYEKYAKKMQTLKTKKVQKVGELPAKFWWYTSLEFTCQIFCVEITIASTSHNGKDQQQVGV